MDDSQAAALRRAFREVPKEQRDAHPSWAIRVWRALSWLERVDQAEEVDERFIAAWIGFNALYGQLDGEHQPLPEREAMGAFLAAMWRLDDREQLRTLLNRKRMAALNLLDNKYLYDRFWKQPNRDCREDLHEEVRGLIALFNTKRMRPILYAVFERLYVMRVQVFHGASTKGSSLNRRTLTLSADLLCEMLPIMLDIMIRNGIDADWGNLCFPPLATGSGQRGALTSSAAEKSDIVAAPATPVNSLSSQNPYRRNCRPPTRGNLAR